MQADEYLTKRNEGNVLVLCGDAPLMDSATISGAYEQHISSGSMATIISARLKNPFGYGRIVRSDDGSVTAIVEQADADERTRQINEVNSGAYWFKTEALLQMLGSLSNDNNQGEYYLTQVISLLCQNGFKVDAFTADDDEVVLGANDRIQLAYLNERARVKVIRRLMSEGVDIPFPDSVYISPDAKIGSDTQILPNTIIKGKVSIGSDCVIGPNCCLENTLVSDGTALDNVSSVDAAVDEGAVIGPFARLDGNTHIMKSAAVGSFSEIQNSTIGIGSVVPRLSFVGSSDVGDNVSFGSASVTAGSGKDGSRCRIGDNAVIGSNCSLVNPVKIGRNARTAVGATVSEDVPDSVSAKPRARQMVKKIGSKNGRSAE